MSRGLEVECSFLAVKKIMSFHEYFGGPKFYNGSPQSESAVESIKSRSAFGIQLVLSTRLEFFLACNFMLSIIKPIVHNGY